MPSLVGVATDLRLTTPSIGVNDTGSVRDTLLADPTDCRAPVDPDIECGGYSSRDKLTFRLFDKSAICLVRNGMVYV